MAVEERRANILINRAGGTATTPGGSTSTGEDEDDGDHQLG